MNRNVLLVEGTDDLYAVVQLMAKFVAWGNTRREWPVRIDACTGVDQVLDPVLISTHLSSREVEALGVLVDADDNCTGRWERVRTLFRNQGAIVPDELPAEGLVVTGVGGKRLGAWIMPDNAATGMMETFLGYLVPTHQAPIWEMASEAVPRAIAAGAGVRAAHEDKAKIYTWLSWQDPPGQSMGGALLQNLVDVNRESAECFAEWFCRLYQLERLR